MNFAGSSRGTTYYYVGCNGWKSLSPANLIYWKTAADAKAAGYKVSAQAGCAGPPSVQGEPQQEGRELSPF
jgi:hypothetical protein